MCGQIEKLRGRRRLNAHRSVPLDLHGTQYYSYVQYEAVIDGIPGTFEATIKVRNRAQYERYSVGDRYVFRRPAPR